MRGFIRRIRTRFFTQKVVKTPEEHTFDYIRVRDWVGYAKACYELGAAFMDSGEMHRAVLWLHRADTIYSAQDEIYEAVGDELINDCTERIGRLEEEPLLYNDILTKTEEMAEQLEDLPYRMWGLLAMARVVPLGYRLDKLSGCEVLGRLEWAVDTVFETLQQPCTQQQYEGLTEVCNALYELSDSEYFFGGGLMEVAGGKPFHLFDLNGMMTLLEINCYLDNHLRYLAAKERGEQPPRTDGNMVSAALMLDYYVRTTGQKPEDCQPIQSELKRIDRDYDFVRCKFTWEDAKLKLAMYKRINLFA